MTTLLSSSAEARLVEEARFRVMGSDAHVIVVGAPGLLDLAQRRLDDLEARWSRFRDDSELSRVNAANGAPVVVSADTFTLLVHARDAWRVTGGAFDPTVLEALKAAGYDRDFAAIRQVSQTAPPQGSTASGCADIDLDPIVRSIRLPLGVTIDLGGIGKGFAADLVTGDLLEAGARGACVNLGGDLRVDGAAPEGAEWVIAIERDGDQALRPRPSLRLVSGAVATTSRARRTWRRGDTTCHHIIDPRTGRPADTPWVSATVIAARAVHAEPFAKAAFLAPTVTAASDALNGYGLSGLLFDDRGRAHRIGAATDFILAGSGTREN